MSPRPGVNPSWGPLTLRYNRTLDIGDVGPYGADGQHPVLSLKLQAAGYTQTADATDPSRGDEYYVVADLGDSTVSPGNMAADDDESKGYYTHAIDVRMSLGAPQGGAAGLQNQYGLDTYTPQSSPATGSGTISSGSSETLGFFGAQLTASGSVSSAEGGSRSYQDYEVQAETGQGDGPAEISYHLALRVCDAGPYKSPFSLIRSDDKNLAGLPPRATSNLPLTSAASFVATGPAKEFPGPAELRVTVRHWLAKVVWYNTITPTHWLKAPDFHQNMQGVGPTMDWASGMMAPNNVSVDVYDVTKGPGVVMMKTGNYYAFAWSGETTWSFRVDFGAGRVDPS